MKNTKKNFSVFLVLSVILFCMLVFPNATGAKDTNMLAVFEIDEFAQFPHFERMLTTGESFYQTIRNFVVYLHYFYGYPFYFFSALAGLPVRLLFGSDWNTHTQLLLTILRQFITVLPMLGSIGLWLSMTNAFRSTIKTCIGFLALVSIPAVFENFFWWHPDSLAFLFVSLTFYFLKRDDLNFTKNFWFAAVTAGLAIGTKHLGEFFVFSIPIYLIYGTVTKKISIKKLFIFALAFVVVMAAAIIISNPLLLLPIERGEIIRYQLMQFKETTQGSLVTHQSMSFPQWFQFISQYGAGIFSVLIGLFIFYMGFRDKKNRLFLFLVVGYLLPYGIMIFGGSSLRPNYLIPFFVPFYSAMILFLPEQFNYRLKINPTGSLLYLILLLQVFLFLPRNLEQYQAVLTREQTSPSIQFYAALSEKLPDEVKTIVHDWQVYIPSNTPYQVHYDWDNLSYPVINAYQPDLIILEQSRIRLFSGEDPTTQLSENVDGSDWLIFYQDAQQNQIDGYHLILSDQFGKAFLNNKFSD